MEMWWYSLPEPTRERVDGLVLRDSRILAVRETWEGVKTLWGDSRAPRPGLYDCEAVVAARYEALADRIVRTPEPPRDVETLVARVAGLPGRPVAVEAIWDGDTSGWFVVLVALFDDPRNEVELALIRRGPDTDGMWPQAKEAAATGKALAERFDVPFHFPSPDAPDDEAPRWRAPER
ncbi:hypothetical protein [Streptomyces griseocarneus]|uniref:hypothetical protein n=1 Tax=Streptomyces griseocarneus TaxID=51201 RepID=UPI00167F1739|nr:hypothetical protein [Streptomyces griseocarneus]MBZ6475621.1 hypothetical protein [Streptomyces griseocarneus]GHG69188.1 hypothetical protein GCM10018779_42360 [Streptomyces griseocarneus]